MSERLALFDELQKGGYEACLMTTFNMDFPFYEDVLLRRMQVRGIRHHVVLADQGMFQQALLTQPPLKAGYQYSLAPMNCPGAVHPKVFMLLGPKKGLLVVGSHNLTMSGYGQNLEVTNVVRYDLKNEQHLGLFWAAFQAFRAWLRDYGEALPGVIPDALEKTLNLCPWLKPENPSSAGAQFLYSSRSTENLWDQVLPTLPDRVQAIDAIAPFVDPRLAFLAELANKSETPPLVGIQPEFVSAPATLSTDTRFRTVNTDTFATRGGASAYKHAKVIALHGDQQSWLIAGSANLTWSAWLASPDKRNAEAVLFLDGSLAEAGIESLGLGDLADAQPVEAIPDQIEPESVEQGTSVQIFVLAVPDGEWLMIPLQAGTRKVIGYYPGPMSVKDQVEVIKNGDALRVAKVHLRSGMVLNIELDDQLTAVVLTHHTKVIEQHAMTGHQQRLRMALGSLETDSPDITLLFNCIDKMMQLSDSSSPASGLSKARTSSEPEDNNEEVDSLIVSRDTLDQPEREQGLRAAKGNVALLLDALIYSVTSSRLGDSAAAFGEDAYGRNEEDLRGSDDEETEDGRIYSALSEPEAEEIVDYTRRRTNLLVKRLTDHRDYIKAGELSAEGLAAALAVVGVCRQLHRYKLIDPQKENCVPEEALKNAFRFVFAHVFSESQAIGFYDEQEGLEQYEEYYQLLGYAAWLAFVTGTSFSAFSPLSTEQSEQDWDHHENAVLVFLAQRIIQSPTASATASRLPSDYGEPATVWLITLLDAGRRIEQGDLPEKLKDYRLARSPQSAYWGYRLVKDVENGFCLLPSIQKPEMKKFKADYLELTEILA
jgi:hypothetical protein